MGREGSRKLLSRASATQVDNWIKGEGMPVDEATEKAIEEEAKIMTSLGRFGRTESIKQDEMSEGEIRAIYEQRKVNANLRKFVEDSVKAWSLTPDGQEAIANDREEAIKKKAASVLAEVMTDDVVESMDAEDDQALYERAQGIEESGAVGGDNRPIMLPRKGLIETEYELNDKGGFSPKE